MSWKFPSAAARRAPIGIYRRKWSNSGGPQCESAPGREATIWNRSEVTAATLVAIPSYLIENVRPSEHVECARRKDPMEARKISSWDDFSKAIRENAFGDWIYRGVTQKEYIGLTNGTAYEGMTGP